MESPALLHLADVDPVSRLGIVLYHLAVVAVHLHVAVEVAKDSWLATKGVNRIGFRDEIGEGGESSLLPFTLSDVKPEAIA